MDGFTIRWSASTGSTNRLAMDDPAAPPWTVWVTDHQTSGRGRHAGPTRNDWHDSPGQCLLMSVLVEPQVPMQQMPRLTLVAGVAAAEALTLISGVKVGLKWPNDLIVDRAKLGGILVEGCSLGDRGRAVIGLGVNVNNNPADLPAEIRTQSTSLWARAGARVDRLTLLTSVLGGLRREVEAFEARGGELGDVHSRWESLADVAGRRIRVDGRRGLAQGLSATGALRARWDDGGSGEVDAGLVEWDQG